MSLTLSQLAKEAMLLPATSRAQLADQLVESLANADADEVRQLWAAEALRRRDEVRSGLVQPISGRTSQHKSGQESANNSMRHRGAFSSSCSLAWSGPDRAITPPEQTPLTAKVIGRSAFRRQPSGMLNGGFSLD